MFRTVISKDRRSRPTASGTSGLAADRHDLLEAARGGNVWAVGQLCDRHGGALFGLARAILGDSPRAEAVVVDVIAGACTDRGAIATVSAGSLRRELARLTYLYSTRCLSDMERPVVGAAMARRSGMTDLARQQRSAVALVQCGDHAIGDVADLLGLPVSAVAVLLTSGLRDLEASDRGAAASDHGFPRPRPTGPPL